MQTWQSYLWLFCLTQISRERHRFTCVTCYICKCCLQALIKSSSFFVTAQLRFSLVAGSIAKGCHKCSQWGSSFLFSASLKVNWQWFTLIHYLKRQKTRCTVREMCGSLTTCSREATWNARLNHLQCPQTHTH